MFWDRSTGLESLLHRPRPSRWQLFLQGPCIFLAQALYKWHVQKISKLQTDDDNIVSIVCISDTHNNHFDLPPADILVHAGDLTQSGTFDELQKTICWLNEQPHPIKVVIAGNHDVLLDDERRWNKGSSSTQRDELEWGSIKYLQNGSTTITCPNGRRLNVYGSPMTPEHGRMAFQYPRGKDIWENRVPDDTDILITHGPPRTHLDLGKLGCASLLRELWRVHPALHVFGHIHEGYGQTVAPFDDVQAAYEQTLLAGGGIVNFFRIFVAICVAPRSARHCKLVNAALVGGLHDDERRKAIVVFV